MTAKPFHGYISMGLYADDFRNSISGTTITETQGSPTWAGYGILRVFSDDVFVSGMTNVLFGIHVGAYQGQMTDQIFTATIGLYPDGLGPSVRTPIPGTTLTKTVKGHRFIWWSKPYDTLVGLGMDPNLMFPFLEVTITTGVRWWADGAVVCDAITPPLWQPRTSGVAKSATGRGFTYSTPALCSKCADERLLKPSEDKGEPRFADWVEIRDQIESL
jgi:hypothetical protein